MTTLLYECGDGEQITLVIPDHSRAHEWPTGAPGNDVVTMYPRSFSMLRTTTIDDEINVKVSALYYLIGSTLTVFNGGEVNLTAYLPTTENFARLVAIGLNKDTNLLEVVSGDEVFDSAITPPIPPEIPSNWIPSALIKLHYNALAVSEVDITDIRLFLGTGSATAGSNWPYDKIITVSQTNTDADYDTIQAAINAATSNTVILIDSGLYNESLVIDVGVALVGFGGQVQITGQIIIGSIHNPFIVTLDGITVTDDGTGSVQDATNGYCVKVSSSDSKTFRFINCRFACSRGTHRSNLWLTGGDGEMYNCDLSLGSFGSTTAYMIRTAGGSIIDTGSTYLTIGATDFLIDTGDTITLIGSKTDNGNYTGGGTLLGNFLDDAGDLHVSGGALEMTEISTPSNPAAGDNKLYFKSDDKLYRLNSSGTEAEVGGSAWPFTVLNVTTGVKYASVATAISAATAGDVIELGEDITEDVTLNKAVTVQGASKSITLDGQLIITAAAKVRDLTLLQTGTSVDNTALTFQTDNALVEDCVIRATGAGTNNYAVSMFGSYTGNELRNCDVLASGATNNYAAHLAGVAGTPNTFTITGGKFGGATDDVQLNKSDMTLYLRQGPVLVNNDLNAANGTVNGNWNDTDGNIRLAAGEDVYSGGDLGGLFQRGVNHWRIPVDHFNTFSGWTWLSGGAFSGAPSTVDVSTYPSLLKLTHSSAGTKHFAYRSSASAMINCRLAKGPICNVGIRIDDGTDTNYVELVLADGATGTIKVQARQKAGGGITTQDLLTGIIPGFYLIRIAVGGTTAYGYLVKDTPIPFFVGTIGAISSRSRVGIIYEQGVQASPIEFFGMIDFIEY